MTNKYQQVTITITGQAANLVSTTADKLGITPDAFVQLRLQGLLLEESISGHQQPESVSRGIVDAPQGESTRPSKLGSAAAKSRF